MFAVKIRSIYITCCFFIRFRIDVLSLYDTLNSLAETKINNKLALSLSLIILCVCVCFQGRIGEV